MRIRLETNKVEKKKTTREGAEDRTERNRASLSPLHYSSLKLRVKRTTTTIYSVLGGNELRVSFAR